VAALLIAGCATAHRLPADLEPRIDEPAAADGAAPAAAGLRVLHPYLEQRIRSLEARSRRFAEAMEMLRAAPFPIAVGTPEQVMSRQATGRLALTRAARVGEFTAVADPLDGTVREMHVWVAVDRIARRALGARRGATPAALRRRLDAQVDAVLIHELWGHAVPVAETGNLAAHCPDPRRGEPPLESCVMRRENDLRAELGLEPRRGYPLSARQRH
jgi:hypothetical protein